MSDSRSIPNERLILNKLWVVDEFVCVSVQDSRNQQSRKILRISTKSSFNADDMIFIEATRIEVTTDDFFMIYIEGYSFGIQMRKNWKYIERNCFLLTFWFIFVFTMLILISLNVHRCEKPEKVFPYSHVFKLKLLNALVKMFVWLKVNTQNQCVSLVHSHNW